ncbi:hypothetical protein ACHAO8_008412 [Botrytis cinerea]
MSSEESENSYAEDVDIAGQQNCSLNPDELRKIEAWLEPTDYLNDSSEFNRHIASRAPGTGLWICDTPQYQKWHNTGDQGSLWVKGVPGAGKSVISASLVHHLKATEKAPHFSDEQLWGYLLLGLSSFEKVYCVVDALDEMEIGEEKDFLQRLKNLATFRPQHVKILMTSRPVQELQLVMKDASIAHISFEDDRVGKDIDLFISHRLESMFEGRNPDVQLSLQSIICDRSARIFLYARLILDQLIPAVASKQQLDLEEIASTLPVGMQDMYNSILLRQSKSTGISTDFQVFLLNAVIFSSRLLHLTELADLLASVYPPNDLSSAKTIVKSACAPLLEIMNDETCIGLCFATTLYSIGFRKAKLDHSFLDYAIRNWTYHGNKYDIEDESVFDAISSFLSPERLDFRRWLTLEWGVRFITKDSVVPSPAHVAAFSGMSSYLKLPLSKTEDINSKDTGGRTILHWACKRGNLRIVELLLQHRAMLDIEDHSHLRPVHDAARRNFAPIVMAILKAGVNPTRSTDDNSQPDLEACARNREGESDTALGYMCINGHIETIFVTLPFLEMRGIEEALWRCLMNRKSEAVRAILTNTNVSLSSVYTGTTMLYDATVGGSPSCVEQVLIRGVDPNAFSEPRLLDRRQHSAKPQDRKYFQSTALHVLAERWGDENRVHTNEQILNMLLKYGANLEAKDSNGRTPLWLCFASHTNVVAKSGIRCFLSAGSSATMTDNKGHGSIYSILTRTKVVELLKLLIHHGANVSALSKDGESCLEALFAYRFTTRDTDSFDTIIQFMVKNGARCDVQPVKRLSIIERVVNSKNYNIETFKILLQHCEDKETKRRCLFSLNRDTKQEMIEYIQELILSGISLEERDEEGCTALASSIHNPILFQALRDCGARTDAVDNQGKSV